MPILLSSSTVFRYQLEKELRAKKATIFPIIREEKNML